MGIKIGKDKKLEIKEVKVEEYCDSEEEEERAQMKKKIEKLPSRIGEEEE